MILLKLVLHRLSNNLLWYQYLAILNAIPCLKDIVETEHETMKLINFCSTISCDKDNSFDKNCNDITDFWCITLANT